MVAESEEEEERVGAVAAASEEGEEESGAAGVDGAAAADICQTPVPHISLRLPLDSRWERRRRRPSRGGGGNCPATVRQLSGNCPVAVWFPRTVVDSDPVTH